MPRNSRPPPIRTPGDETDEAFAERLATERVESPEGESTRNQAAPLSTPGMIDEAAPSAPPSHGATPSGGRPTPQSGSNRYQQSPGGPTPQSGDARHQEPPQDASQEVAAPQTPNRRPPPPPLTFDSRQDKARAFIEPYKECCIRLSLLPGQAQESIEAYFRKQKDARIRAGVEMQLKRLAAEAGDIPGADQDSRPKPGEMTSIRFNAAQVVQAFKARRPQTKRSLIVEAMDGKISWGRMVATIFSRAMLLGVVVLLLHLALAMLVFGTSKDVAVDSSGALVDPATQSKVATARTVQLHPLWDYPKLEFSQLRRIEDVVFVFNAATHVLHVAVIEKGNDPGDVFIKSADGDVVRIEHSGSAYWQRVGHEEVFLAEMEAWRAAGLGSDPEVAWLTSGVLATQVNRPASTV